METAGESTGRIMKELLNDGDSVEIAKQDLSIIFNKINNSLRDIDEKKKGANEKECKSEVSFKIEDQQKDRYTKAAGGMLEVPSVPSSGTAL